MPITCTKKFAWTSGDVDRIYFPGDVIEDQDAAAFARMTNHAEERGEQEDSRILPRRSPEDKKADLAKAGGETKAERKAREKAEREAARAQGDQAAGEEGQDEEA